MDRPFLDANILYSAASKAGTRLRNLWELADTELLSSAYAVEEARRNLAQDRLAALADLDRLVETLTVVAEPGPERTLPPALALPDKDRLVLLAAIGAGATHFLTGDKRHFGPYRGQTIESVLILTPGDYLDLRGV